MLIGSLCVSLLFSLSCKKDQQSNSPAFKTDEKKFTVNFNLSEFQQKVETMSVGSNSKLKSATGITLADSLKNHINNLLYLAYDSAGNEVGRIRQYITFGGSYKYHYPSYSDPYQWYDKPFGSIVDTLPAGKYTIVFIGSTYVFLINDRYGIDPSWEDRSKLQDAYITEESTLSWRISYTGDTFVKKFTITVDDQNTQQEVKLDRITGKLDVNILDAIPEEADKFEFRFDRAPYGLTLNNMAYTGSTYYDPADNPPFPLIQIKPSEKGTTNYQYTKFLFGGSAATPVNVIVEVRCLDKNGKVLASKKITEVPIFQNKRTILKGKLFDNSTEASFNVSVNAEWDPNTVEVPF